MQIKDRVSSVGGTFAAMPRWKKSLIAFATLVLTGGGLIRAFSPNRATASDRENLAHAASAAPGAATNSRATRDPDDPRVLAENPPSASSRDPFLSLAEGPDPSPGLVVLPRSLLPESHDPSSSRVSAPPARRPTGATEASKLTPSADLSAGSTSTARPSARAESSNAPSTGGTGVAERWAPGMVQGGFSFFAALCAGFVLRTFAKMCSIVLGVLVLTLVGLSHLGFVEVHWDRVAASFDAIAATFRTGPGGVRTLLETSLPSGVLGGLGLFAGMRRG